MDEILKQILNELKALKEGQEELRTSQEELRSGQEELRIGQEELRSGQIRIEEKLDAVYVHTAKITENITETNMKIDRMSDDIEYLKHKEHQTEEDLFKLKKNLKIIK